MDTHTPGDQHLVLLTDPEPRETPRWLRTLRELPGLLRHHRGVRWLRENWSLLPLWLALLIFAGTLLWLLWVILRAIVSGIAAAGDATGDGLARLATWITEGPVLHALSEPVRHYLDTHTAGLPATGGDLWMTWLVTATGLYVFALLGSTYARIGWAVIGALSAAAAYAGAAPGAQGTAAGLIAAVWLLLSLPAYARRIRIADVARPRPRRRVPGVEADTRPASHEDDLLATNVPY
ncbi:hypothetical protein [Couchioplanes caeruleus]|uniref:Uncharacterized protein n=2 Tax=Couchioplanes caeruleus TaxID=56438 RepID=A0A1K0GYG6_9ACTN|nr:hypothetical protein [Couchioplanes caeruleus]OJF14475.1 hypothetical protein BG844_09555 [Couchioplanes caeruleus subsp. caeruleus]ROP21258.1 hypothetical protein EDD30_7654 [Couchioplanes caeruleus]